MSTHATSYIVIHNIKPDNFMTGIGQHGKHVNAIDFGPVKTFCDPKTYLHIPYRENKNLTGTYCSVHVDQHPFGVEQVRRDDLKSLAYVLMYFLRGVLP